jgi:hypothetical protein
VPIVALKHSSTPDRSLVLDGKKFLWDGHVFDAHEDALRQAEAYEHDNFEVRLVEQGEKHLVYTRRAVKEVVVTTP